MILVLGCSYHTPNVPDIAWIKALIHKAARKIPVQRLWVNPDCGLKTRGWEETRQALDNMVKATKELRKELTSIKEHPLRCKALTKLG